MSYFDEARAISALLKMRKLTQGEMAKSMGVSQSFIANKVRLCKFPKEIENEIIRNGLSERHARALLRLENKSDVYIAIEKIVKMNMNVRQSEVLIDSMVTKKPVIPDYKLEDEKEIRAELERSITSALKILQRLGKQATQTVSFYDRKKYITICIDEY